MSEAAKTNGATKGAEDADDGRPEQSETPFAYYALEESLKLVTAVQKAGGNKAPEKAVMDQLSLKGRDSWAWTYRRRAAGHYGLITRSGRGDDTTIEITTLAKRIAFPESDADAQAAKMEAFLSVPLHKKLAERYMGAPVPDAGGLANVLKREYGIVETMARPAANAFINSARFVGAVTASGIISVVGGAKAAPQTPPAAQPTEDDSPVVVDLTASAAPSTNGGPTQTKPQMVAVPADFIVYRFPLRRNLTLAVPLPPDLTNADVARLHKFLETLPMEDDTK